MVSSSEQAQLLGLQRAEPTGQVRFWLAGQWAGWGPQVVGLQYRHELAFVSSVPSPGF